MACTECHGTGTTMFNEPCPHLMAQRPGLRARVRARIARWAYRTGRFDLAMRLSPETYWNEAHRAAERSITTGYHHGARELRGDD